MPLPDNISKVTVTGKYLDIFGLPIVGKVQFTIKPVLVDGGAKVVIVPRVVEAVLDKAGAFSVDLPATDDPDLNPTNFTITVTEQFEGGGGRSPFQISLPQATTEPIDITQFATTQPPSEGQVSYATLSALQAEATNRSQGDQAILDQKGAANGITPLGADLKVAGIYLPDYSGTYIPAGQKGVAGGVASLDGAGLVPDSQMPNQYGRYMGYGEIGRADGGVPGPLDTAGDMPASQIPNLSATYQSVEEKAIPQGYPSLDSAGQVPKAQIPLVPDKVPFFTNADGPIPAKASAFDDMIYIRDAITITGGTIYLIRVPVRTAITITRIDTWINTAAVTPTVNQIQLYNATTQAAIGSSNAAYATLSAGLIQTTLLGVPLAIGEYWVAILVTATTMPTLGGITSPGSTLLPANGGRTTAANLRFATHSTTGQTSFPATVTPVATNARQIFAQIR